jgi:predicted GNAT family acetyltransferase
VSATPRAHPNDQFELTRDGHTAYMTYEVDGDRLRLLHTEVPDALGGQGVGAELVRVALDHAARNGLTVVPICPFAREWLQRHRDAIGDVPIDWSAST